MTSTETRTSPALVTPSLLSTSSHSTPAAATTLDKKSLSYVLKSLLAGGIAGCAAKTAIAPLDRVKILFQTSNPQFEKYSGSFLGVFRAARSIQHNYGLRGLFQGHSATLLRIFPYAAIKFMVYEQYKDFLMPRKEDETNFKRFLAGSMAGVTSVFFSYPLDILRTRLAFEVHGANSHVGLLSTAGIMYREKNPFGIPFLNFYRGFLPTIYGMIPYAGVSFLFYEKLKLWAFDQPYLLEHPLPAAKDSSAAREGKRKLKVWAHLGIGGLSGAIAQTASYPLEVIRRNMQIAGKASGAIASAAVRYPSTLETARLIYSRKGFRGFFVGLSIGYLKITPMSAVSFFVYEYMKGVLNIE